MPNHLDLSPLQRQSPSRTDWDPTFLSLKHLLPNSAPHS